MLGEKITATIKAKYYFGAPVTKAKVKYKVAAHRATPSSWYPLGPWDWFYGPGYWWFAYDYAWYPGWREWGCPRPMPVWWRWSGAAAAGGGGRAAKWRSARDGTVKVEIDTAVAKAIHADQDHQYEITAEVTDQSRRTIVGTGTVLVARKPFKVYAWVDRGHYRVGDVDPGQLRRPDARRQAGRRARATLRAAADHLRQGRQAGRDAGRRAGTLDTDAEGEAAAADQGLAGRAVPPVLQGDRRQGAHDRRRLRLHGHRRGLRRRASSASTTWSWSPTSASTSRATRCSCMVNTDRPGGTVLLFVRPANGVYLPPKVLRLEGKSTVERDRGAQEGHAQLLRRGGDRGRRQGLHRGDARSSCRRRSGCSTWR